MKKSILLLLFIASSFTMISCGKEIEENDVYVTVYPLEFMVQELFDDTDLTVGIVPGTNSHEISVEWAPKEIIAMKDAELMFYIGANYDQYIDKKLSVFEDAHVQIIKIEEQTDYIEYIPGIIHEHDHEDEDQTYIDDESLGIDPHFWISPKRMLDVLELLHDQLNETFSEHSNIIDENYLDLKSRLEALDLDYTEAITAMTKPALTSTNLYGYLEADYGLEFIHISSGYHEKPDEFKPADAEHIMDEVLYHNISLIIYEKNKTSPASDNIFEEMELLGITAVKEQFNILQALSDDEISQGKNYITEMQLNLSVITAAGR